VGISLNNLAELYYAQGRYTEAEPLHKRAFGIRENVLGPDHPEVANSLDNLAWLALAQRDWRHAADYWERATKVIERRAARARRIRGGFSQRGSGTQLGVLRGSDQDD
jgi:tetratricopeptide (TPR) repeat protein